MGHKDLLSLIILRQEGAAGQGLATMFVGIVIFSSLLFGSRLRQQRTRLTSLICSSQPPQRSTLSLCLRPAQLAASAASAVISTQQLLYCCCNNPSGIRITRGAAFLSTPYRRLSSLISAAGHSLLFVLA